MLNGTPVAVMDPSTPPATSVVFTNTSTAVAVANNRMFSKIFDSNGINITRGICYDWHIALFMYFHSQYYSFLSLWNLPNIFVRYQSVVKELMSNKISLKKSQFDFEYSWMYYNSNPVLRISCCITKYEMFDVCINFPILLLVL